jgi:GH15 family glucan-1,4-alpha-glucosidase
MDLSYSCIGEKTGFPFEIRSTDNNSVLYTINPACECDEDSSYLTLACNDYFIAYIRIDERGLSHITIAQNVEDDIWDDLWICYQYWKAEIL